MQKPDTLLSSMQARYHSIPIRSPRFKAQAESVSRRPPLFSLCSYDPSILSMTAGKECVGRRPGEWLERVSANI